MEFQFLLDILLRRKWLIMTAVIVPAIAAFLLVSTKDRAYKSEAVLSTGLIGTGLNTEEERSYIQDVLIKMDFGSRVEKLKGPSMIRLLAYEMLIHDLDGKNKPFRSIDPDEKIEHTPAQIKSLVSDIKIHLDTLNTKVLAIDKERIFKDLSKALKYDYQSISENLNVYRRGDTDYIGLDFKSEDPYLSAYLINQLLDNFLRLNKYQQEKEYQDNFEFAQKQATEKRYELDSAKLSLNLYRSQHNVLDLESQSQELVKRIHALEEEEAQENSRIQANLAAISKLNEYIKDTKENKRSLELNELLDSEDLVRLRTEKKELENQYVNSGDPVVYERVNMIQKQIDQYITRYVEREKRESSDLNKNFDDSLDPKRLNYTLDLIEARNRALSISDELRIVRKRQGLLTTDINKIALLESEVSSSEEDYAEAKEERNKSKVVLDKAYQPLTIIEHAQVADKAESSHRMLITAFSGVLGGGFSIVAILMLAFMDMSLNTPHQFRKFANINLIGTLNEIKKTNLDLHSIFSSNGKNASLAAFKESIRNLRYAVEQSDGKTFLFTSTQDQTGKTFLMVTLAYALTLKQKKVLLIDTNFKNNTLTQMSEKAQLDSNLLTTRLIGKNKLEENFESKMGGENNKFTLDHVDIIGNRGGVHSPSEILAGKNFKEFIAELEQSYDFIFIEGASLNKYADSRELLEYADKVLVVFGSDNVLKGIDKRSIKFLQELDEKLIGAILNKLELHNLN